MEGEWGVAAWGGERWRCVVVANAVGCGLVGGVSCRCNRCSSSNVAKVSAFAVSIAAAAVLSRFVM